MSEILTIANSWHDGSKMWTWKEPKFRLCWIKLCSSDNHHATAPRYHPLSPFLISCKTDCVKTWTNSQSSVSSYLYIVTSKQLLLSFFFQACNNNFWLCLIIRMSSTLTVVWFNVNEIALSSVSSDIERQKSLIFSCINLLLLLSSSFLNQSMTWPVSIH